MKLLLVQCKSSYPGYIDCLGSGSEFWLWADWLVGRRACWCLCGLADSGCGHWLMVVSIADWHNVLVGVAQCPVEWLMVMFTGCWSYGVVDLCG